MISRIKQIMREIIDFGLLLIAIAIILELLFGPSTPFLGQDIIDNLVNLIQDLGDAGVVGLISIAIIIYLWNKASK
ncbi:MAG: hypothetical protein CMD50_01510 [Gammaproteobacteria bacterium]|nr:hypothetical protein [Gammaproteobacteria bacterium]